ncbi:MAG TPA: RuBisCO large subunit C-terminal-like domain-containing protein [Gemmatimonadales bacterium]|jgi:ribulose-bisphosphate carboxylase large chain
MADRIHVTYEITASDAQAGLIAEAISREQTVELPPGAYPEHIEREIVGRIEAQTASRNGRSRVEVSYDARIVGADLAQLLNLVCGNVSLLEGVRVVDLALPAELTSVLGGPRLGIAGLRKVTGTHRRPLLVGAMKPVGLTARELANLGAQFARGGMDIIKDDHGLADQPWAPFRERVARCSEAIAAAAEQSGTTTLYAPNITGPSDSLLERVAWAVDCGCPAVMVSPLLQGLDAVRLARDAGVAVLAHPTMSGAVFSEGRGIAPHVLYGTLLPAAGCDGVIFTVAGGRFPVSRETSLAVARRIGGPRTAGEPALPILGGGIDVADVPSWIDRLGTEIGFLVGSSLYASGNIERAVRNLVATVEHSVG